MLLSRYCLHVLHGMPSEASIISHRLMLRAGMIRQLAGGIYSWLPFGLAVLNRVTHIVREEMNKFGALEASISCIQPVSLWKKSGRFGLQNDLNDEMLLMKDRGGNDFLFSPTAEEAMVELMGQTIQSYRMLPVHLYQIGWKFRDEIRPRYGVMRSREFLMKDAYSFHMSKDCALKTYEKMLQTYVNIYKRLGLVAIPVAADSGTIGGDYSHEFHVLADTGESTIFYEVGLEEKLDGGITLTSLQNFYAMEESKHSVIGCAVPKKKIISKKGIEVGHIFYLGNKYSKAMGFKVQTADGSLQHPDMGCYGIGISRLVGAIIEANHDKDGIIWPISVAPFSVLLINLKPENKECNESAFCIYSKLQNLGLDILYDDTNDSPGVKFIRADLIGIPAQIIISERNITRGGIEVKDRRSGEVQIMNIEQICSYFAQ